MAQAASLPLVAITAWEALIERAQIKPGDNVLVHGGTGGVGHIGIQLAKLQGAKVTTTVSSIEKEKIVKGLGADEVINYRTETVKNYVQRLTNGHGFDVIFDTVGGKTLDQSFEATKVGGQVASISTFNTHDLSQLHLKGLSLHVILMLIPLIYNQGRERHGEILRRVADLVDLGKIHPLLDVEQFNFSNASAAHQRLESGNAIGKVVLVNP